MSVQANDCHKMSFLYQNTAKVSFIEFFGKYENDKKQSKSQYDRGVIQKQLWTADIAYCNDFLQFL